MRRFATVVTVLLVGWLAAAAATAQLASFVEDRGRVSIINYSGNFDRAVGGEVNAEARQLVAQAFYEDHPDNYDFLIFFTTFEFDAGEASAFHIPAQNSVEGIGTPLFDASDLYGSDGRLLGTIDMADLDSRILNPLDPAYERTLVIAGHELMHQWGARVRFELPTGELSDALIGRDGSHWSYLLDTDASLLYGSDWRDKPDGTFNAAATLKFYSPLDLYLAGFFDAGEVPPIRLIENAAVDPNQIPELNASLAGSVRTVAIEDIIAAEGPRVPAAADSQHQFRAAIVVVKRPEDTIGDDALGQLNVFRDALMTRFSVLTGGRGILEVFPEAQSDAVAGLPDGVDGGPIRVGGANVEAALAWLRSLQDPLGFWQDHESTRSRDTVVALRALQTLDPLFTGSDAAIGWFGLQEEPNIDFLARKAATFEELGLEISAERTALAASQNPDGGWGLGSGFGSDPLDTAFAMRALGEAPEIGPLDLDRAIAYLTARQNADGGWGSSGSGASRTLATVTVLNALGEQGGLEDALSPAIDFLATRQNADGGFGDSPSTAHDTALVLNTFVSLQMTEPAGLDLPAARDYLASNQTVGGSWEGSIYTTALAATALRRFNFSNWYFVEPLQAEDPNPGDGDRVRLTLTIGNDGALASPEGVLRIYDGDPGAGGTPIGPDLTIPLIVPGQTMTFMPIWDTLDLAGAHELVAVIDPLEATSETSEVDNVSRLDIDVEPPPPGIDLQIAVEDILVSPAQPNVLPETLGVSAVIRNSGLTDALGVVVRLVEIGADQSEVVRDEVVIGVPARSSTAANFSFALTQPGTSRFEVRVDPDQVVPESDEANNQVSFEVSTLPSLDLAIATADIELLDAQVFDGEDVTFEATLRNRGTVDSPLFDVRYLVSDGATTVEVFSGQVSIQAGSTLVQSVPWRVTLTGNLSFIVEIDPDALVPELDEVNNSASLAFTAGAIDVANATVGRGDLSASPNPALEGLPLDLSLAVRNTGGVDLTDLEVAFYDGDPEAGGVLIESLVSIPSILTGESVLAELTWSRFPSAGDRLIVAVVDPSDLLAEFSEDDNSTFIVISSLSLPDATTTPSALTLTPRIPIPEQPATLDVLVSNLGQQAAPNLVVRAFLGDPASGGAPLGPDQTVSLPGSGTATATFDFTLIDAISSSEIVVVIDPDGTVEEGNEANNEARLGFAVQDGDFFVSNRYFSPNGDGVKETTELFFRLEAAETVAVEVRDLARDRVVRREATAEFESTEGGRFEWDGRDDLGRLARDADYAFRVVAESGAVLGEVATTLDTNRSSLLLAAGTIFERLVNLTCEAIDISGFSTPPDVRFSPDERTAYFFEAIGGTGSPIGIYRTLTESGSPELIVPGSFYPGKKPNALEVSRDGAQIVFEMTDTFPFQTDLVVANNDGTALLTVGDIRGETPIGFGPDGQKVLSHSTITDEIRILAIDGFTPPRALATGSFVEDDMRLSPDHERLLYRNFAFFPTLSEQFLADVRNETAISLGEFLLPQVEWDPTGARFALTDSENLQLLIFDRDGGVERSIPAPADIPEDLAIFEGWFPVNVAQPAWSGDGTEVSFRVDFVDRIVPPCSELDEDCGDDGGGVGPASEGGGASPVAEGEEANSHEGEVNRAQRFVVVNLLTGEVTTFAWAAEFPEDEEPDGGLPEEFVFTNSETHWDPNDRAVLQGDRAIFLDEENRQVEFQPAVGEKAFLPSGNRMLIVSRDDSNDPESECYQPGSPDGLLYRSLLNLSVDLKPKRASSAGGVALEGTAVDRNFDRFFLEYAPIGDPDDWRPLAPAADALVIEGLLAPWVPPAPGTFLVRLTAEDKAGNRAQEIKRVTSTEQPSITDLWLDPRYFSPNGDGIKDAVGLHYRVLLPVELDFFFFNVAGERVRTISRSHTQIGQEFTLVWDGRDDQGLLLPDGDYRVEIQSYEFLAVLDRTPPAVDVSLGAPLNPGLRVSVNDKNKQQADDTPLERGVGASPAVWEPLLDDPRGLSEFVGFNFRQRATDLAGNEGIGTSGLLAEDFAIRAFGGNRRDAAGRFDLKCTNMELCPKARPEDVPRVHVVPLGPVRLFALESLRTPLAQVFIRHQPAVFTSDIDNENWFEVPVTEFLAPRTDGPPIAVPDHSWDVVWDLFGVGPGVSTALQLRGVDTAGNEYVTFPIIFRTQGVAFHGLVDDEAPGGLRRFVAESDIEGVALWGEEAVEAPLAKFTLVLRSEDDVRFFIPQEIEATDTFEDGTMVFFADLQPSKIYFGFIRVVTEPTEDPVSGLFVSEVFESGERKVGLPPLLLSVLVTREGSDCGEIGSPIRSVQMTGQSLVDEQLQIITLARLVGDEEDVIFNINMPTSGSPEEFEIDTASWDEGFYPLVARVRDIRGDELMCSGNGGGCGFRGGLVVVDRALPSFVTTFPNEGDRVCGAERTPGGLLKVEVEGSYSDNLGVDTVGVSSSDFLRCGAAGADGKGELSFSGTVATVESEAGIKACNGPVTLDFSARDLGGNKTCSDLTFFFDGKVEGADVTSAPKVFSPNGDGFLDGTTIDFGAGEPTLIDLSIFPAFVEETGICGEAETPVASLAEGLQILSTGSRGWDGRDGAGVVVPDGAYAAIATFRDACGHQRQIGDCGIRVDTTPPELVIDFPQEGDPLPMVINIIGSVADPNLQSWRLDWGEGFDPETWAAIDTCFEDRPGEDCTRAPQFPLASWNTFGLSGAVVLRFVGADSVGNVGELRVQLELAQRETLINALEVLPPLFSPNGDDRRETAAIRFGLEDDVIMDLTVFDSNDGIERSILDDASFGPGPKENLWDGLRDTMSDAPSGEYRVEVFARLAANPLVTQIESVPLILDRIAPFISVASPSGGFATSGSKVNGSITDENLTTYAVSITDTPGAPAWSELASGTVDRTTFDFADLEGLAEGAYALLFEAEDRGEIRTEKIIEFIIDDTDPVVAISAPESGSFLSAASAPFDVLGEIEEDHLSVFRLEVGSGAAPTDWTVLTSGTELPVPEPLLAWDFTSLADGPYTLRLTAIDGAGNTGEARVTFAIDTTPPTAAITLPADGDLVAETGPVEGTASDANLEAYTLAVAPTGSAAFSEVGQGSQSVTDSALAIWSTLPPDGVYTLKLEVTDQAGNAAEALVEVTVDTQPPAPPIELTAEVENSNDARLDWTANTEADLAGYAVYRDGALITPAPIAEITYLDPALLDALYVFEVTAIDNAGNESARSNQAELLVDSTPPEAEILLPADGAVVTGVVEIIGTAIGTGDFSEYRLWFEPEAGGAATVLATSPTPLRAERLGELDTFGLTEGALFRIRLEAEDIRGNVGSAEIVVEVDNLAPAAPTGLTATAPGLDVDVNWNANTEPDLLGYLLFRDGVLVNAPGTELGDDLRPFALTSAQYDDELPGDGTYEWVVYAIDEAGNVSGASLPAEATVDTQPPAAFVQTPIDGFRFDGDLYILALSDDNDIAQVRFQFSAAGVGAWTDIGVPDTAEPWEANWDVGGLAFGDFDLRAVATDNGAQTDPAPSEITVTFIDLDRPDAVIGLAVQVDGGDASLTWTANGEPDLGGYHVDRALAGVVERLTPAPIPGLSLLDAGLADATYVYTVSAIDTFGNEAEPSNEAEALVYTPELEQPFTPRQDFAIDLVGSGPVADAAINLQLVQPSGATELDTFADPAGAFSFPVNLESGVNALTVRASDGLGNVSKPATVEVVVGGPPSAPTGLVASAVGLDVTLSWNANPEPDVIGYRPFRDGEPVLPEALVPATGASASSENFGGGAGNVIDGNPFSAWRPDAFDEGIAGEWVAVTWADPRLISAIEVSFDGFIEEGVVFADLAADYDVQAWTGLAWVTVAEVRDNEDLDNRIDFAMGPYLTDQVRVLLRGAGPSRFVAITEIEIFELPLVSDTTFVDTVADGVYSWTVTAFNDLGFESGPSEPAELPVGDVEPPEPVVLAAAVTGSDVELSWTASASPDVVFYRLFRDGELIAEHFDLGSLLTVDAGLPNGVYAYTVAPVDTAGNQGALSNEAEATVQIVPPGAPSNLVVTDPAIGGTLDLSWDASIDALSYQVSRAQASGGPYEPIATTTELTLRDTGLTNGVEYFYIVEGLDAIGNASAPSNEASGVPTDEIVPEPPAIFFPASPGMPFETRSASSDVAGSAEPGVLVRLSRAGVEIGQATARLNDGFSAALSHSGGVPRLSPDGRYGWFGVGFEQVLIDFESDTAAFLDLIGTFRWLPDASGLLFANGQTVGLYTPADGSVQELAEVVFATEVVPRPGHDQFVMFGQRLEGTGIWLFDLATEVWTLLVDEPYWWYSSRSATFSPDGELLAYGRLQPALAIEVLAIDTVTASVIDTQPASDRVSWAPDGSALSFISLAGGASDVWIHEFGPGSNRALTVGAGATGAVFSADGRSVAYAATDGSFRLHDLASAGERDLFSAPIGSDFQLDGAAGYFVLAVDDSAVRLEPAGRFEVAAVALEPGDNLFSAVAEDAVANVSAPSDEVLVRYLVDDRFDLTLEVGVIPTVPLVGTVARATVVVTNLGFVPSPDAEIDLTLLAPGGPEQLFDRLPVAPIPPGGSLTIGVDFTADPEGDYGVVAVIDPLDLLDELREDNNSAAVSFSVAGDGAPAVAVTTDLIEYGSNEDVTVTVEVVNFGEMLDGNLVIAVTDEAGFEVSTLATRPVIGLGYGESVTEVATWNTGGVFAGGYRAEARLTDPAGLPLASGSADFAVRIERFFSGDVASDRLTYDLGSLVRLTGIGRYDSGNALTSGATARLAVFDATAALVAEWNFDLGDLLPGSESTLNADWNSGSAAPGPYTALFEVADSEGPLASASTAFDLMPDLGALEGTLALSDGEPVIGNPVTASFSAVNASGADLTGLGLRVRVVTQDLSQVLAVEESTVDMPADAVFDGSVVFDTSPLELIQYTVLLEAVLPISGQVVTLDSRGLSPIDGTPPTLALMAPAAGFVTVADVMAEAMAQDIGSGVELVEIRVDGGPWMTAPLANSEEDRYDRLLPGLAEGAHQAEARAFDSAGNASPQVAVGFTVDSIPPEIQITGVTDGLGSEVPVTPVIVVTDANLDSQSTTLNGEPFVSGTEIVAIGNYSLFVTATDLAGNRSTERVTFQILGFDLLVDDVTVTEGDVGMTDAVFTVTLSRPSTQEVTVDYRTVENTALAGQDFVETIGTLVLAPGEVTGAIPVPILGDLVSENQEDFGIELLAPVNATLLDEAGFGVVLDNDAEPAERVLSVADAVIAEGDSGTTDAVVTLSLSAASADEVSVDFATVNGTAIAGLDFQSASGTVVFPAGATERDVVVPILGDLVDETDEMLTVQLSNAVNATAGDFDAVVTILDDDEPPAISIADVSAAEGDAGSSDAVLVVTLSAPSAFEVSADFATADGTASAGVDYGAAAGTVVFPAGTTERNVVVPILGDLLDETDEALAVELSNPVSATAGDLEAVVTILDDDEPPAVSIADVSVPEGDAGSSDAVLMVTLSLPSTFEVSADFATADGTASAGVDYEAAAGTVVFPAGTTEKTVVIPILGDLLDEPDKALTVDLSNLVNATAGVVEADVTILDDDEPPAISIADVSVAEGDAGSSDAVLDVTLSAPSSFVVSVDYATADGTATHDTDYQAVSGTVTFPAGATTASVTVPILGDELNEPDETFTVDLANPVKATIADAQAVATILNSCPLDVKVDNKLLTNFAEYSGCDTLSSSNTRIIPRGRVTYRAGRRIVLGNGFSVEGSSGFTAIIDPSLIQQSSGGDDFAADATIDEAPLDLSIDDVEVQEGDKGTTDAVLTVTLSRVADRDLTLDFSSADGTAASEDYQAASGTLTIPAGATAGPIAVPVIGDTVLEDDESPEVEISNASEGTIVDGVGVITILDDELCLGPNLISNPGAEQRLAEDPLGRGVSSWLEVPGTGWQQRFDDPRPIEGKAYFFPGANDLAELRQDVDVTAYASAVVSGGQGFVFSGRVRTFDELPSDTARIVIEYRDVSNSAVLDVFDSGEISSPVQWRLVEDLRPAPAGTGWVRVRLIAARLSTGPNNDGYFDDLGLRSVRVPVITAVDRVVDEGDIGVVPAVYELSLSCASDRPVSVEVRTADATAVAGFDYQTLAPVTVEFAPGTVSATVAVDVRGDTDAEDDELFVLALSNPSGGVLRTSEAFVLILDDDAVDCPPEDAGGSDSDNETESDADDDPVSDEVPTSESDDPCVQASGRVGASAGTPAGTSSGKGGGE